MSTLTAGCELLLDPIRRAALQDAIGQLLGAAGDPHELLQPDHLAERLEILDEFDRVLGGLEPLAWEIRNDADLLARAWAIKEQFEGANRSVYEAARAEIAARGRAGVLCRCMQEMTGSREKKGVSPGLSFDLLDEIVCGVLQLREPGMARLCLLRR